MTAVLQLLSEKPMSPGWAFAMSLAIGIGVTIVVAIIQINREKWKEQLQRERELKTLSKHSQTPEEIREAQELRRQAWFEQHLADKDFVNRHTTELKDFIINDALNYHDIEMLAYLNGIRVECGGGWTDLILGLMRDLDEGGWNRKVSSIKEKFGELRFYAGTEEQQELVDRYTNWSRFTCEECGRPGETHTTEGGWMYTACAEHGGSDGPHFHDDLLELRKALELDEDLEDYHDLVWEFQEEPRPGAFDKALEWLASENPVDRVIAVDLLMAMPEGRLERRQELQDAMHAALQKEQEEAPTVSLLLALGESRPNAAKEESKFWATFAESPHTAVRMATLFALRNSAFRDHHTILENVAQTGELEQRQWAMRLLAEGFFYPIENTDFLIASYRENTDPTLRMEALIGLCRRSYEHAEQEIHAWLQSGESLLVFEAIEALDDPAYANIIGQLYMEEWQSGGRSEAWMERAKETVAYLRALEESGTGV